MAPQAKGWNKKDPAAPSKAKWRVVIESYTEYATVVEASGHEEAEKKVMELFPEEDQYHGERWENLGTIFRVKGSGRASNEADEPPAATFLGPNKNYPSPEAGFRRRRSR